MNKELEEAIKILTEENSTWKKQKAIKNLRDYIDNSISKEVILYKIRGRQFELQQEYIDFKDDIKLNTLQDLLEEIEN